jgi:hypothetical protein
MNKADNDPVIDEIREVRHPTEARLSWKYVTELS